MNKIKLLIALIFIALFSATSFAQTYPDTCPPEAQGILNAVGGCAAVDCQKFPVICEKCCVTSNASVQSSSSSTAISAAQDSSDLAVASIVIIIVIVAIAAVLIRRKQTSTFK